jgi:hypothetical protein
MVNKVVMCLGTNDVSKCKDEMLFRVAPDIDAFIKLSSIAPSRTPFDAPNRQAIARVKSHFPDSLMGICGIFPQKGTGNNTNILNATTTSVNNFIRKLCMKDPTVEYIDTMNVLFFYQRMRVSL